MKKEIKIILPIYKIAYAIAFILILGLIRRVTYTHEVGAAIEAPFAILAAVFCADTYVQEMISNRSEVHRLYPIKRRVCSIRNRMIIQEVFLIKLAVIGYGLFFIFQNPEIHPTTKSECIQFFIYFFAITVTAFFWGILANTLSMLFRNMWMGIGGCLFIWGAANSLGANKFLGVWNVFSYSFREIENTADFTWLYGKILCIGIGLALLAALPKIVRKRG